MSNPLYLVGPNQGYKQVQDALWALSQEVGYSLVNDVEIRVVESGAYKPFKIFTLRKTSYTLTIGAAPGVDAVISGKVAESKGTGIRLQWCSGVTIRRLIIQDFTYGIYGNSSTHYLTVDGCRIHRRSHH